MEEHVRQQVEVFLEAIDQFLQLLLGIRNLPESEEWQDDRVIGTLRLMAFIEKRHRAIFIRYVHRLVDHHIDSKQFTEAALTLKLHADLYAFDDQADLAAMPELSLPEQSEASRKEVLYLQVLELLSKGKSYEPAIALSKGEEHTATVASNTHAESACKRSQPCSSTTNSKLSRISVCLSYWYIKRTCMQAS
jgi:hypothetical protein